MPNYNSTLQSNNTDLQAILNAINELPNAGGSDPVLQDKTITPTTSKQTITADIGYDGLDTVTINAMPTATQATPAITVNASGLITATATQTAGYVAAGTKSATHQLAFQAAKTITPSTASQIAVSSGYYTGGNITVASVPTQTKTVTPTSSTQNITPDSGKFLSKVTINGDSDLVAGNIKSGVSIFGVSGTYEGSGGGDTSAEDGLVTTNFSGAYTNNRVTTIGSFAFAWQVKLTSVNFPNVTIINTYAFSACNQLQYVSFPKATRIDENAFNQCGLVSIDCPLVTRIETYAFSRCNKLTSVNFPRASNIGVGAFANCASLTTINFPVATKIEYEAFYSCTSLTTASFPATTSIGSYAFLNCYSLKSVNFPGVANVESGAFYSCTSLTTASFPAATSIGSNTFAKCFNLKSLYLTGSRVCKLSNSNAFSSTPIGGYSTSAGTYGSIYVPTSLLTSYKTATNWTYFSSRFVGV